MIEISVMKELIQARRVLNAASATCDEVFAFSSKNIRITKTYATEHKENPDFVSLY